MNEVDKVLEAAKPTTGWLPRNQYTHEERKLLIRQYAGQVFGAVYGNLDYVPSDLSSVLYAATALADAVLKWEAEEK